MDKLLYKEFRIAVHPLYIIASCFFGALVMIPQWIFFLVPLYFCMVSAPNLLGQYRANKDNQFTMLLPVSRADVVKARIMTFSILELIHMVCTVIFIILHRLVYGTVSNFSFDLNGAYVGLSFVLFGVFNIVLFPLYYRDAQSYGIPVIAATLVTLITAGALEVPAILSSGFATFMEQILLVQIVLPLLGFALFVLLTVSAYRKSVHSFQQVGL